VQEFDNLSRNLGTSGRCCQIPGISCRIPARLAGISGYLAESQPGSVQNGRTPGIWPDPAVLAESGCSGRISGQLAENWPGRPVSGRFVPDSREVRQNPAKMAGFRQLLPEFVYAKF
jgi:hypothetical protein